ncbi:serine hydrolase domain-containing protein [Paraglaciecola sp.]|uniref:serine hydrolase domain-containing protein n=1 Tax=Paraglaciecola sp. TaxID=1920173 RepID=UPI003EF9985A
MLTLSKLMIVMILPALGSFSLHATKNIEADIAPKATQTEINGAFADIPYLKTPYISTIPIAKNDGILVGKLGADNGDKQAIINLATEITNNKFGAFDSLLISHKDRLVFESYYARGRIDLPHKQASTTKSFVSLAIGRAIQLGYLTMEDLHKPLTSFLNNLDPTQFVSGAANITLHQALSMRTGIRIKREKIKEIPQSSNQLLGQAQVQTYFENSLPITAEYQQFHYQNNDPKLVMQVLDAVVPNSAKDFIQKELLDKLGITNFKWKDDVSGLPMASYWSNMTSRDMLKWGMLIINTGKWNNQQLISKVYLEKATNRMLQINEDDIFFAGNNVTNPGYGYYFWQADMKVANKSYFTTSAQGGGGQYIIMVKDLDLIIVTTAHDRKERMMQITADRILPAFVTHSN